MIDVTLYTKSECSLCKDIQATLLGLQQRLQFHLEEVDITSDDALFMAYRFLIPVVKFGSVELTAPIDPQKLEEALRSEIATH
jgi:hypothetical protein